MKSITRTEVVLFLKKEKTTYEAVVILFIIRKTNTKINYIPHIVIKEEYLGVRFLTEMEIGKRQNVLFEAFYDEVDYSLLKQNSVFQIREGSKTVGIGKVIKINEK